MRFIAAIFLALSLVTCGVNEVTIEVKGGDGNKVRLDAEQLDHKSNHLVDEGSYHFSKVKEGTYTVKVEATEYMASGSLEVKSAPLTGVQSYELSLEIPPGRDLPHEPQGTILYASTPIKVRDWDLYTIPASGGEPTQLTDTREFERHPVWSPDGHEIAFTRGEVLTNIDVFVMAADGTSVRRLTEHPERDNMPAWSPDGTQIAFVSQRDGDIAVWIMDADGGNQRKLTLGRHPAWSPDGRRIALSRYHEASDEIFVIDTDGANERQLTDNKYFDWFPAWSPDGQRLAFNSERFGGQELMMADPGSGAQVRITVAQHTFEQDPDWSPDGRALAYQGKMNFREDGTLDVIFSQRTGKYKPQGTFDIFVVPAVGFDWDDTDEHPIMPINLTNTTDRDEMTPSWRSF